MDIMFFEKIFRDFVGFSYGADIADPGPCRFFHHIAKLTGQKNLSFSRHDIHFNLKRIASHTGPCQTADNSHLIHFVCHLVNIQLISKILVYITLRNMYGSLLLLKDLFGCLSADIRKLSFELPHACLFCIAPCNLPDRLFTHMKLFLFQSVPFHLLRDQVFHRNMQFFILRIAGHLDDLHAIQQRSWYCLKRIGCRDKENLRQIKRSLKVMISEFFVLFAVQHF